MSFTQNKIYFYVYNGQSPYTLTATYWPTAVCEIVLWEVIPRGRIATQHLIWTWHKGVLRVGQYLFRTPYWQELLPTMGNRVSAAGKALNPWKSDVTPDRSTAYHGRGGTVVGGGNCAVDTEVSKQSDVGRNETMVGSSKVVVGHIPPFNHWTRTHVCG